MSHQSDTNAAPAMTAELILNQSVAAQESFDHQAELERVSLNIQRLS